MDGERFDYNNQDELESRIALAEGAFNICTRTNFTPTPLISMTYPPPVHEESRSVLLFFGGGVKDVDLRKLHCAYALN